MRRPRGSRKPDRDPQPYSSVRVSARSVRPRETSMPRRSVFSMLALLAAIALSATSCGSSSGASSYGKAPAQPSTTVAPGNVPSTTVKVAQTSLGAIVVDGDGHTLYLYAPDTG